MKYYKFNRDRSIFSFYEYRKSLRKMSYMARTNRSKLLDSFYYDSQTWGGLHKAWKGYVIAKHKNEYDKRKYYASVIQKLQNELGLRVSSFHDIGMSALKFYSSRYSEYQNKQHSREEIRPQESLRDDKGEYFEGDWNNGDRFTS